jgi:hypothetical protein
MDGRPRVTEVIGAVVAQEAGMTSGTLKRNQRQRTARQPRVLVGGRADPPKLDKRPGVLVAVDNARPDPKPLGADANLPGARIPEVQPPRRRSPVPGVGWHDHRHIVRHKVDHRGRAQLPGASAGDLKQQYGRTKPAAAQSAAGTAIDPHVASREPFTKWRPSAQVDGACDPCHSPQFSTGRQACFDLAAVLSGCIAGQRAGLGSRSGLGGRAGHGDLSAARHSNVVSGRDRGRLGAPPVGCPVAAAKSSSNAPVACGSSIIGVCPTPGSSSTRAPGTAR